MQKNLRTGLTTLSLATAALGLHACGGGGGGGTLELTSISVPNNAIWEINRPIEMTFSLPVDMTTVNSNSISIRTLSGEPALGDYFLKVDEDGNTLSNVVVFQPRCPTASDLSDAGLVPDSELYTLQILGSDVAVGSGVQGTAGETLIQSQQRLFTTPAGTTAQEVFLDTKLGSPRVVVRSFGSDVSEASRLEVVPISAFDDGRRYFEVPLIGGEPIVQDFSDDEPDYPINLFSDETSQVTVVVVFDQPVSPDADNISSERIELQFSTAAVGQPAFSTFETVDTTVVLESNCTTAGARVRLIPIGVLPQDTDLRVVISADFQDIVGEQGLNPTDNFAFFRTRVQSSELFGDDVLADEVLEAFAVGGTATGSLEEVTPSFPEPQADWGEGRLQASFDFLGTGGPGGSFNWVIPAGTTTILNTDTDTIVSDTGASQTVVNGVVNVADFIVEENATLRITGVNPCQIFATGIVDIRGTVDIRGLDALPVAQLNSPNNPQPGAGTLGGSGKGGRGSPLTTTSTPKGEDGFGPGNTPGVGGVGGESGFRTGNSEESRRGGGGGGASFADPVQLAATGQTGNNIIAIKGFDGAPGADGALDGPGGTGFPFTQGPQGGPPGPTVFVDPDDDNNFFGLQFDPGADPVSQVDDTFIVGELSEPGAGYGGGGGGDTIRAAQFPAPTFVLGNEKKGGGGGSGGGQLQILSLGNIILGADGRILANGGRGGEGESTAGTNQVGGGGGGGSGGHVILQTSANLDLSATMLGTNVISAIGGNGAVGKGDSNTGQGAGGRGGVGVVQIHLRNFDSAVILPVGQTNAASYIDAVTRPDAWRLFPSFGNQSRARSNPIPLGAVAANTPADLVLYGFGGLNLMDPVLAGDPSLNSINVTAGTVDALSAVLTEANATITALDPVARTASVLVTGADLATLATTGTEYCYDAAGDVIDCMDPGVDQTELFSNDIYFRAPSLFDGFGFALTGSGFADTLLRVESATVVELTPGIPGGDVRLDLVLASNEGTLAGVTTGNISTFSLFPRFFRVSTGGQLDRMPLDQEIRIRLRGLGESVDGGPDLENALVPWTGNPAELSRPTLLDAVRYLQFEVTFDLDPDDDGGVTGSTALPELEFLRIPIRF